MKGRRQSLLGGNRSPGSKPYLGLASSCHLPFSLFMPVMGKLTCHAFLTPWCSETQNQWDKIPWNYETKQTASPVGCFYKPYIPEMRKIIFLPKGRRHREARFYGRKVVLCLWPVGCGVFSNANAWVETINEIWCKTRNPKSKIMIWSQEFSELNHTSPFLEKG